MDWMQFISTLGFPIVACIFLFKQNVDIMAKHDKEMQGMIESLNNNTLAISKLCDKLEERGYIHETTGRNSADSE